METCRTMRELGLDVKRSSMSTLAVSCCHKSLAGDRSLELAPCRHHCQQDITNTLRSALHFHSMQRFNHAAAPDGQEKLTGVSWSCEKSAIHCGH